MTVPPSATSFATRPPALTRAEGLDLGFIFRHYGEAYREKHRMPLHHWKAMIAIESCRTPRLGGHVQECGDCGYEEIAYNSCRNRHCPKCQHLDTKRWLEQQLQDLLPINYFHVIFTLPDKQLNPIVRYNQKLIYDLLFQAASDTLLKLGRDPDQLGVELGFIAVLHTWSRQLMDHPHLHCIVTGGGLSLDGQRWIHSSKKFLLPVQAVRKMFQGKFLEGLRAAHANGKLKCIDDIAHLKDPTTFKNLVSKMYQQKWNLKIKPSFDKPQHVIDYLAAYTNRVAITNDRILELNDDRVTFSWKDSQDNNIRKEMTLHVDEFIRRFMLHILPPGFVKIRHYGLLSNRQRQHQLQRCRELLNVPPPPEIPPLTWEQEHLQMTGIDVTRCRSCRQGRLLYRTELLPTWKRGPPRA